jgi:hypothetical protein
MSRMIDRMLAHGFDPPAHIDPAFLPSFPARRKLILNVLETSEHFVVDNVCRYFYEGTDQEHWDLRKDFPNFAPPFPSFFMEMREPHRIVSRIDGEVREIPARRDLNGWGVLFQAEDLTKDTIDWNSPARRAYLREEAELAVRTYGASLAAKRTQYGPQAASHLNEFEEAALAAIDLNVRAEQGQDLTPDLEGAKWHMSASLFLETGRSRIVGPMMIYELIIDATGTLNEDPMISGLFAPPSSSADQEAVLEWSSSMGTLFDPAFLAISFLHCKNVTVARQVPPAKLSRAHQKRHHRPLIQYHTLEITPMKKVLERAGASNGAGLKMALHICRGNFKTFTPERRLFGRHTGTYWWDSHVRGAAEHGISVKDYAINQPAASSAGPAVTDAV